MAYLSEKHLEDLRNSGLSDEIITDIGFYTANADEAKKILDRKDIDCECLIIPYPLVTDFFRVRPNGIISGRDGKPAKYLQKSGTKPRLFAHPKIHELLNDADETLPILITEGEKKCLCATQKLFFDEPIFLPICFGGVWNWRDTKTITNKKGETEYKKDVIDDLKSIHIDNRIVYICFDSDIVTNVQVQNAESELSNYLIGRGAIRVASIRIPHQGVKLGLDDYIVKFGIKEFKKLIDEASSSDLIKANIRLIRKLPGQSATDKLDDIVRLILNDQISIGRFFYNDGGAYFFSSKTKKLFNIDQTQYSMSLANDYGLYRETQEFNAVLSKMEEHANFSGKKIQVCNFSYFDVDNNESIVYDNDGGVFIIPQGKSIKFGLNGYKDKFFTQREHDSIIYKKNSTGYFKKYIIDICNFTANENTLLEPDQQKLLFTIWFYSLFYPNLLPTKPILVMTGEFGSGKSTIQRLIGKLLFGNNFNVSTIQGERDFLTSVINKYYLVYDNVDINEEWVRNAIASLSTGFKVEVRKLYSNMEMFHADPIAYLAMNSMGQSIYKRPDIASRLLIFRTKKLQQTISEAVLYGDIARFRHQILSEVLDTLSHINQYIKPEISFNSSFRMADFAQLGYKIATAFNKAEEFKLILQILISEQTSLPLEDNALVDLIDRWLDERKDKDWISTGDLYAQLYKLSSNTGLNLPFKNSQGLGRAITLSLENLKSIFFIDQHRGHSNKMMWRIEHK